MDVPRSFLHTYIHDQTHRNFFYLSCKKYIENLPNRNLSEHLRRTDIKIRFKLRIYFEIKKHFSMVIVNKHRIIESNSYS